MLINENATVVYEGVEWIAIRMVERRTTESEGWVECIDCKCQIAGECVQLCHENHRMRMADYFGQAWMLDSEEYSECCLHKRNYCTSVLKCAIEGFPRKYGVMFGYR